jgi:transcription antitermination factor NusG
MLDYGDHAILCSPEATAPAADNSQWFALAVKSRWEKAVVGALETKGFQTLLPLYKKQHQYTSRFKSFELALFPGYVFCRFNVHTRLPILTTPGVTQILGAGNTPIPVCEAEIVSLLTAIRAHVPLQPFPFPQIGQRMRINRGALAGIEGIVVSFKQCLRLVLSITLLQRSVLLEIDRDHVSADGTLELAKSSAAARDLICTEEAEQ